MSHQKANIPLCSMLNVCAVLLICKCQRYHPVGGTEKLLSHTHCRWGQGTPNPRPSIHKKTIYISNMGFFMTSISNHVKVLIKTSFINTKPDDLRLSYYAISYLQNVQIHYHCFPFFNSSIRVQFIQGMTIVTSYIFIRVQFMQEMTLYHHAVTLLQRFRRVFTFESYQN